MATTPEETRELLGACSTHSQHLIGAVSLMLALGTLTTVLRLYARWLSGRTAFGWDDALACAALLALIPEAVLLIINSQNQTTVCDILVFDEGPAILSGPNMMENMTIYAASIVYQIACMLAKLSICFLFLRVLREKLARRVSQGMIIFLVANCIAFTVPFVLFCNPPSAYWKEDMPPEKCLNFYALEISRSVPHIVTDIIMLMIPLPTMSKLHVSRSRKVAIVITFAMAGLGLVGCCLRLAYYAKQYNESISTHEDWGIGWEIHYQLGLIVSNHIYTMVEPAMYLIAANLPPLRALAIRFRTSLGVTTWLHYRFPSRDAIVSWVRRTLHTPRREDHNEAEESPPLPRRTPPEVVRAESKPHIKEVTNPMVTRFGEELKEDVEAVGAGK